MTVPRADRIALTITIATPIAIRTSPTLNTFANGSHVGNEYASVNGSRAGLATIEELVYPAFRPPPRAAKAASLAGMNPPLATIAARLAPAPTATRAMPGIRMLRITATRTAPVDAT